MDDITIQNIANVCCIGATRVGVLSTLVAAEKWPQKNFVIVDRHQTNQRWTENPPHHHEPGLQQLIAERTVVNVAFETPNYHQQVNHADMVVIATDVNTKQKGEGKRKRLDLAHWDREIRRILIEAQEAKLIVIKSQLPVNDALTAIKNTIDDVQVINAVAREHHIFWVPEFLSAGTAINNLRNPTRVIITPCWPNIDPHTAVLENFYLEAPIAWVANNHQVITMTTSSGILGTMGANVLLAIQATMINVISQFCQNTPDSDIVDVRRIMGSDPPSAGIGGPELLRDLAFFNYLAEVQQNKFAARLFSSIIKCNTNHQELLVAHMLQSLNSLQKKVVCILGFSYKENTSEIINSAAIHICKRLCLEGVSQIRIYDPRVRPQDILECFPRKHTQGAGPRIIVEQNLNELWPDTRVICFLQHMQEFNNLNWQQIYDQAQINDPNQCGAVHLFDTSNILQGHLQNIQQVNNLNAKFRIHIIGRPLIH